MKQTLLFLVVLIILPMVSAWGHIWSLEYDTVGHTDVEALNLSIEDRIVGLKISTPDKLPHSMVIDSGFAYLDIPSGINGEKLDVRMAIYKGSNDQLIDTSDVVTITFSGSTQDGWYRFDFLDEPTLIRNTIYYLSIWSEKDVANNDVNLRIELASGQGPGGQKQDLTYGTWPDPTIPTVLGGYKMSLYAVVKTVRADRLIYNDTADFRMGQWSNTALTNDIWADSSFLLGVTTDSDQDTFYVDGNGDSCTSPFCPAKSHSDSAFYQLWNETSKNETDWLKALQAGVKLFSDMSIDLSEIGSTVDSIEVFLQAKTQSGTRDVEISFDTGGVDYVVDTITGYTSSSSLRSTMITSLPERAALADLEIGARWTSHGFLESQYWYWLWCIVYSSASSDTTRIAIAIVNLDTLGVHLKTGWDHDSSFLYIEFGALSGTAGEIELRELYPKDSGNFAINVSSVNDDTVRCHSEWVNWYAANDEVGEPQCSDTIAWEFEGADSQGGDYVDFDTIPTSDVVANTLMKIEITDFIERITAARNLSGKRERNGLLFVMPDAESGSGGDNIVVGNVQPFGGVDSAWIEIFGQDIGALEYQPSLAGFDKVVNFNKSSQIVIGRLDSTAGGTLDGIGNRSSIDLERRDQGPKRFVFHAFMAFVDSTTVHEEFPLVTYRIDSCIVRVHITTTHSAGEGKSLYIWPILRYATANGFPRQWYWGTNDDNDNTQPIQSKSKVTSCWSKGEFQLKDQSGCTIFSSNKGWDGDSSGAEIRGTDISDDSVFLDQLLIGGSTPFTKDATGSMLNWARAMQYMGVGSPDSDTLSLMNAIKIGFEGGVDARIDIANDSTYSGTQYSSIVMWGTDTSTAGVGDNLIPKLDTKPIRGVGRGIGMK